MAELHLRRRSRPSSPACRADSTSTLRPSTRRSTVSMSSGPGFATACASRALLCAHHIHVYVDRERAGLDTALEPRSRVDVITAISGG